MSNQLSTTDQADFKRLKIAAIAALELSADSWRTFLMHMREIQKRELWRVETETWSDFLDGVCKEVGKTRQHFYKLLRAEEIRLQLSYKVSIGSDTKNAKSLAKAVNSMSTEALLEAGKAPAEKRLEVVEKTGVQFEDKPPTAKAIAATVKVQKSDRKASDKSTWPHDDTPNGGHPIPPPAWQFWERRNEVQEDLNQISTMKVRIQKAKASGDSLYSWIGTPAIDALQNAYTTIGNAKLYAVCTKCQGWWDKMSGGGCSTCHNTGLLSKHQFDVCSDPRVKNIRKAANQARA